MLTSDSRSRPVTLEDLNQSDRDAFVAVLGDTVENAPWVADSVASCRPFASIDAIWQMIMKIISGAPIDAQVSLFRGHPELAGAEAVARRMSSHSTTEQDRLGLVSMHPEQVERLGRLNAQYRTRFGYPFIVALRLQRSFEDILDLIARRLQNDSQTERLIVLREIGEIVRGRLELRIGRDQTHDD